MSNLDPYDAEVFNIYQVRDLIARTRNGASDAELEYCLRFYVWMNTSDGKRGREPRRPDRPEPERKRFTEPAKKGREKDPPPKMPKKTGS